MRIELQNWLNSKNGQIFLNYAYSWGAAVVILGALFKLTHLDGANLMLFLGMGTEVLVFFLSGFESPFMSVGTEEGKVKSNEEIITCPETTLQVEVIGLIKKLRMAVEVMNGIAELFPNERDNSKLQEVLASIRNLYELQLKSASSNLNTIDRINSQTSLMADRMEEINVIYGRMIDALKVK